MQDKESALVILDTNVMIHCRPLIELPWAALVGTPKVRLAITPSVLREIDKLKQDGNLRRAKRARRVLPLIRSCEASGGSTLLTDDITFSMLTNVRPDWANKVFAELDKEHADDRLVAEAWTVQNSGESVYFLCNDTLARVRASSLGLVAAPIPERWILSEEPDERDKEIAELRAFKSETENRRPQPFVEFENGDTSGGLQKSKERFLQPEQSWLDARVRSYLAENPRHLQESHSSSSKRITVLSASGLNTAQIDAYIESYDVFIREVDDYFRNRVVETLNSECSFIPLAIRIGNRGGVPAEGFTLKLQALDGGGLLSADHQVTYPKPPTPPSCPKSASQELRERISGANRLDTMQRLQQLRMPSFATQSARREPEELVWCEEPDKSVIKTFISMRCDLVRHGTSSYKRSFVYQLPHGCDSGAILATISCTNLPHEITTRLNFHVVYEQKPFIAAVEKKAKTISDGIRINLKKKPKN
jgi:hypothetical protein